MRGGYSASGEQPQARSKTYAKIDNVIVEGTLVVIVQIKTNVLSATVATNLETTRHLSILTYWRDVTTTGEEAGHEEMPGTPIQIICENLVKL